MTNLQRRLLKLESGLTDTSGLLPRSKAWLAHWERKIDQIIAGDDRGDLRGIPLAAVDAIIQGGTAAVGERQPSAKAERACEALE